MIGTSVVKVFLMALQSLYVWFSKIWQFVCYIVRKQSRTVIQYQTVRYHIVPLSPLTKTKLNAVRKKILVLDLDETLIHSHHDGVLRPMVKPGTPADFILRVTIDRHPVRFFVHKRPHVDYFLGIVGQWYDLVIFTASMEIYGAAVADRLDRERGLLRRRYFRQHCTLDYGGYTKDLKAISADLSSIMILDNSPGAYRQFPDNAIPIKSWFSDPTDTALLNLLPFLDALRFTSDVRSVLSRNLQLHRLWMKDALDTTSDSIVILQHENDRGGVAERRFTLIQPLLQIEVDEFGSFQLPVVADSEDAANAVMLHSGEQQFYTPSRTQTPPNSTNASRSVSESGEATKPKKERRPQALLANHCQTCGYIFPCKTIKTCSLCGCRSLCHLEYSNRLLRGTKKARMLRGDKPYVCFVCGWSCRFRTAFTNHLRIHACCRPHICHDCHSSFADVRSLSFHQRVHCLTDGEFTCEACEQAMTYDGPEDAIATVEIDILPSSKALQRNMLQLTGQRLDGLVSAPPPPPAVKPPKPRPKQRSGRRHKQGHGMKKKPPPPPNIVKREPDCEERRVRSYKKRPTAKEEVDFLCAVCCKSLTWKSSLPLHLKSHAPKKFVGCHLCPAMYKHEASRRNHLRVKHQWDRPFTPVELSPTRTTIKTEVSDDDVTVEQDLMDL